jgi:DNA-binding MarR family transcriptional regulator
MAKTKEQTVGIVARGTIVELAKSMLRQKISACESAIRAAKYGREATTFKPSDAPTRVREAARELVRLKANVQRVERQLEGRGYCVGSRGALEESYSVVTKRRREAAQLREARLAAARALREETLIALVSATSAAEAGKILKALRSKLNAI